MKKWTLALLLLLLALPLCARAEIARDITAGCHVRVSNYRDGVKALEDRNELTAVSADPLRNPFITITPDGEAAAAVYIEFGRMAMPFQVQVQRDGAWQTVAESNSGYQQLFAQFEPLSEPFRLQFDSFGVGRTLSVRELFVFSAGEIDPELAHAWQPTAEKADILFIATHPDDELLWFGGAIPTYAGARGKATTVVYATCSRDYRLLELLNGLWHCGVRTYPIVGDFKDFQTARARDVLSNWGKKNLTDFLVRSIRQSRPEVVVTQDLLGEYGHANHIAVAQTVVEAVQLAADESYDAASLADFGPWQAKKLYVHLGESPTTVLDWHQPLEAFGGKDAYQVACEAFAYHRSQNQKKYGVADVGDAYDSSLYTLVFSTVGEDVAGNDFFENLE